MLNRDAWPLLQLVCQLNYFLGLYEYRTVTVDEINNVTDTYEDYVRMRSIARWQIE